MVAAVTLAAGIGWTTPAIDAAPTPVGARVVDADEVVGWSRPSISGDGRWVVFQGEIDGRASAFRLDRSTGQTVELTPSPTGLRSGDTVWPVLSGDGCVVVVQTELALDLFRDDDRGSRWDVYRTVVPECGGAFDRWELVSSGDGTGSARDDVDVETPASVNESGSVVAYSHPMPGRRSGISTISVVDLTVPLGSPDRVTELPAMPAEAPTSAHRYRGALAPALSGDGRFLAFVSDATSHRPVPEWGPGRVPGGPATTQVFVWDRAETVRADPVRLVSGRNGTPAEHGASSPVISRDGRVIAFESADRELAPAVYPRCGDVCPLQVFRSELLTDPDGESADDVELTLVSARSGGSGPPVAGSASSWSPAVNVDGSQVAFTTWSPDLLPARVARAGTPTDGDIVVAEIPLGTLRRATDVADLGPIPAAHARPVLSATGRVLAFETAVPDAFSPGLAPGRRIMSVVAQPAVSLAQLDFGTVLTGWNSDELWVSVLNEGPGAFAPTTLTTTSPNFRVLEGGTCVRGVVVPAGGSCTVYLSFNPTADRSFDATLVVSDDGPDETIPELLPDLLPDDRTVGDVANAQPVDVRPDDRQADDGPAPVVALTGQPQAEPLVVSTRLAGRGGEPVLRAEPAGLDLGRGVVTVPGERRAVDIRNVSFTPTRIDRVTVAGAHPSDFVVTAESCTDRALNPNATCAIEVEFVARAPGRRTASLTATTDTGEYTAAIVGGVATLEARLEVASVTVPAGGELGVGLAGFAPDSLVTLAFADSARTLTTVRVGADGSLLHVVGIQRRERGGDRTVVATGPGGVTVSADVRIERGPVPMPGLPGHGTG